MFVLWQFFYSEYFYEQCFINVWVCSLLEVLVGVICRMGGIWEEDYNEDFVGYFIFLVGNFGQEVFNLVDVVGWLEYYSWLMENMFIV